jgi:hypothetical protein
VASDVVKAQAIRDVKPDPKEVDRLYKDAVREWQLRSLLFQKESDAKATASQLAAGKKFDAVAKELVASKKAQGGEEGSWVPAAKLLPHLVDALKKTKVGATTPALRVQDGWTVILVEAVRYPDDPAARARAEATSRLEQQKKALKRFYDGLVKRYAKIDEKLLKKLDFEAKQPGFEALKKDPRVLATFQEGPPVTVGDLTRKLEEQFYHGIDNATQRKRLNRAKLTTIDEMVAPRVVAMEAKRLGVQKTPEYQRKVAAAENGILFGAFVQKAVLPDVKLSEEDLKKYYEAHKQDFTYPAFYRMEAIGFAKLKDAEAAVAKLRSGTDFKWLNANAEGKLPETAEGAPRGLVSEKAMPAALVKALEGAKSNDYRVYAAAPDQAWAVHLLEVIPSKAQPYEEARQGIGERLFGEAVQKNLQDWIGKIRKAHSVQVFLVRIGN